MKIKLLLLMAFALLCRMVAAQGLATANMAALKQGLQKMQVLGSVLYIAAHPDDENTRLLAYLAQGMHYRTGYLSLTRGDGGQNLTGTEQAELLGLVRTQELLAARKIDGAEQFFTRANDFGFTKSPKETLSIWDKEKVLSDVVWVIRQFKPDVIICRFPTTGEGGHGQHTASAILAQEAFAAAADPQRFPEQLAYVQPWQAKRLLWNTFSFGGVNTTSENQFKIQTGGYNALLGKTYGELAAESRSAHKSQGMGTAPNRSQATDYFKTLLGSAPQVSLLDGINTTWTRVKGGQDIAEALALINKNFDETAPEKSVSAMVQLLTKIEHIDDVYWRNQKAAELKNIIAACAGLWFEATSWQPYYAQADSIKLQAIGYFGNRIAWHAAATNGAAFSPVNKVLQTGETYSIKLAYTPQHITQPYWLQQAHNQGVYTITNQQNVGRPQNTDLPTARFEFVIEGKPIVFECPVVYKYTNPVRGEVFEPLNIAPTVSINLDKPVYVATQGQTLSVSVKLKCFATQATGNISLKVPQGWAVSPASVAYQNKHQGDEWAETFTLSPQANAVLNGVIQGVVNANGTSSSLGIKRLEHEHIPAISLFPVAEARLIKPNLKLGGTHVAYISGAGDLMPDALQQAGYQITILSPADVNTANLSAFDAIITGVRAYNVNNWLATAQPKLLNYVNNGGVLLVQYNNNAGLVTNTIGPYPFKVVNQRVTNEDAAVTYTDANNAALNYPNVITQADFEGWVQERGLYFATDIDSRYQTPLLMNDEGEAPNKGSLLIANYGKGKFVYTSLAFFRQLPAGVPGAFRLFANLLAK